MVSLLFEGGAFLFQGWGIGRDFVPANISFLIECFEIVFGIRTSIPSHEPPFCFFFLRGCVGILCFLSPRRDPPPPISYLGMLSSYVFRVGDIWFQLKQVVRFSSALGGKLKVGLMLLSFIGLLGRYFLCSPCTLFYFEGHIG